MRKSTMLWLGLASVCGALLFLTSQKVTDGRQSLALVQYDIQKEEESLRVLQAEWSYLNHPDRLEKLAREYLPVTAMQGRQFVRAGDLGDAAVEIAEKPATAPREKARIEENLLREDFSPASLTATETKKTPAPKIVAKTPVKTLAKIAPPVAKSAKPAPRIVNANKINRDYVWRPPSAKTVRPAPNPKLSTAAKAPVRGPAVKTAARPAPVAQAQRAKPVAASPDFNALMKNLGVR